MPKCKVCKRELKNPASIEAGMGPVCAGRVGGRSVGAARRRANYEILEDGPDVLLIRDLGPWDVYPTVTNAAEEVVAELAGRLNGRRLEYIDSDGQRDQLVVRDGRFVGFAPASKTEGVL